MSQPLGGLVLGRGKISLKKVHELLTNVHSPIEVSYQRSRVGSDFRAQSISDAVTISTRRSAAGLDNLFFALEMLAFILLLDGYFVRGGITRGRLYHDDNMVFGEALIEAYRLESQIARFPRIIIPQNVFEDLKGYDRGDLLGYIRQSQDGPRYLHVLNRVERLRKADKILKTDVSDEFVRVSQQISKRFSESVDNPNHFEKVQWFAKYWNSCLPASTDPLRIHGPGLATGVFLEP
jgi:hypothetical protein